MNQRYVFGIAAFASLLIAVVTTSYPGLWSKKSGSFELYGNVDIREVEMAFAVGGRVQNIWVEEGQKVAVDDLLAAVDTSQSRARLRQVDAEIEQARAELTRLRNGNRPQEIMQAQLRVSAAQAVLRNAQADHNRRQALVGDGAISRDVWDQTIADLRRSEAQLAEANQGASLMRAGSRIEDIRAAEARLQASLALRSSVNIDLSDARLVAPVDGTILTRAIEPGSLMQPGTIAFTIAVDRPMRVRAYVAGPDLSRISPGMKVKVRADGNAKTYSGTIGYISPRAEFTPKSVETEDLRTDLVYRLRITVSNPDNALRQGQPVTVTIPRARSAASD